MRLNDVLRGIETRNGVIPDMEIKSVTTSPERINIKLATLFVLVKGIKYDTDKIIDIVIEKSPSAIIADEDREIETDIPVIKVKNARLAYAAACYNLSNIDPQKTDFYGITGTNGKTTTATILYRIFRDCGIKSGFIGTGKILINDIAVSDTTYSMTTPDPEILYPTIRRMQEVGCKKIVMEVSSHSLALHKVYPLSFAVSVFTNLSEEHLDFHEDMEDYFYTKLSLFYKSRRAVFNLDDRYCRRAMNELKDKIDCYGIGIIRDADAMARDIILDGFCGSKFIYREKDRIFKIILRLSGSYNIYNTMLAVKCALLSGIPADEIKRSIKGIVAVDGRFEIISEHPTVIIDYAHTEKAMENLLKFVNSVKNIEQNIYTVFGCGGERDTNKRPKMAACAEKYSDFTIVTTDNCRHENADEIIKEIERGFSENDSYTVIKNRRRAIEYAIAISGKCDIVVITGKGHERYNIDASGYHKFDEREIVKEALKENERKGL